jgi:hypothetical protein
MDTLTITSVLPGVAVHYLVLRAATECGAAHPGNHYVWSTRHCSLTSIMLSSATRSISLL